MVAGERASGMVSGGVAGGGWLVGGGGRETRRICRTRATRSECCPARKNGYSFSNVPDAHARFPAKRMAGVRSGGERVRGRGGKGVAVAVAVVLVMVPSVGERKGGWW